MAPADSAGPLSLLLFLWLSPIFELGASSLSASHRVVQRPSLQLPLRRCQRRSCWAGTPAGRPGQLAAPGVEQSHHPGRPDAQRCHPPSLLLATSKHAVGGQPREGRWVGTNLVPAYLPTSEFWKQAELLRRTWAEERAAGRP